MVCQLLYSSEYINGCNISKFGEGCEKCVPLFNSSWMYVLVCIGICVLSIFIISIIITIYARKHPEEFMMKCSNCNKPMENYTLQAYTNEGDKFFCKECTPKFLFKNTI